jgi:hypothetical protein
MIVFKVIGKDKESGEEKILLIGAESEFRAAQLAREKGLVPTSITAEDMEPSELRASALPPSQYYGFVMVSDGLRILVILSLIGAAIELFFLLKSDQPMLLLAILTQLAVAYVLAGLIRCCGHVRGFFLSQSAKPE